MDALVEFVQSQFLGNPIHKWERRVKSTEAGDTHMQNKDTEILNGTTKLARIRFK